VAKKTPLLTSFDLVPRRAQTLQRADPLVRELRHSMTFEATLLCAWRQSLENGSYIAVVADGKLHNYRNS
jgi:hypothetical protein